MNLFEKLIYCHNNIDCSVLLAKLDDFTHNQVMLFNNIFYGF